MTYLFNEMNPFPNSLSSGASAAGKNKGVYICNITAGALVTSLYHYRANGTTWENRITVPANSNWFIPIRVWGVSAASGITGALLA